MRHIPARLTIACSLALAAGIGAAAFVTAVAPRTALAGPVPTVTATATATTVAPISTTTLSVTADSARVGSALPAGHFLNNTENLLVNFNSVDLNAPFGIWMGPQSTGNVATATAQAGGALTAATYRLTVRVANGTRAQLLSIYATTPGGVGTLPANGALLGSCNLPAADAAWQVVNECTVVVPVVNHQISANVQVGFTAVFKSATLWL